MRNNEENVTPIHSLEFIIIPRLYAAAALPDQITQTNHEDTLHEHPHHRDHSQDAENQLEKLLAELTHYPATLLSNEQEPDDRCQKGSPIGYLRSCESSILVSCRQATAVAVSKKREVCLEKVDDVVLIVVKH